MDRQAECNFQTVVNRQRQPLQDVLPLETPYSVFVDVCSACNFRCRFCAVQYAGERRGYGTGKMDFLLFRKIMDDLAQFPQKLKVLRLYGNGEPLLHKEFPEMVRYAREKNIADWMETVTNASLLTPDLNRLLVRRGGGLDRIRISIEGIGADAYREMAGTGLDWDSLVENIRDLYEHRGSCEIYIKTVDAAVGTEEKKEAFFETFGNICDRIFIEHISPVWPGYEEELQQYFGTGNKKMMADTEMEEVKVCPFPFYQMFIHSDGTVSPCCPDWQKKLVLGNAGELPLSRIWNGDACRTLQKDMLGNGRPCRKLCAECSYPGSNANDNIDACAADLLGRF